VFYLEHVYDLIILGAGPGGLSAAIYAQRAMLDFLILEKWLPGGEIANTFEVENYLGVNRLSGMELADKMVHHAQDLGVNITICKNGKYCKKRLKNPSIYCITRLTQMLCEKEKIKQ